MTFTGSISDINSDLDGLTYQPTQGFTGGDTLTFSVNDDGNSGDVGKPETATSTVAISVNNVAPTAGNVSFKGAIGNTTFGVGTNPSQPSTNTSGSVLSNSSDDNGDTLTAVPGTIATTQGGSVSMNADGTFTYNPPAGYTGDDTFNFQVSDGTTTSQGQATITVANMVWYVTNSPNTTDGVGTSTSPFNTLADVTGPNGPTSSGDDIFLFGSSTDYAGGIQLKTNQTLVGQSVKLVVGGQTVSSGSGSNPTITNSGGTGITLADGDTVDGITVSSTSGAGMSASGANGFTLTSNDAISNAGADGLDVSNGGGTISVAAAISGSTGHSVSVSGRTSGTATFSGSVSDTRERDQPDEQRGRDDGVHRWCDGEHRHARCVPRNRRRNRDRHRVGQHPDDHHR